MTEKSSHWISLTGADPVFQSDLGSSQVLNGYRATASAFSRDVLASTFGIPEPALPAFPFTPVDPLIVPRPNPADPMS